MAEVVPQARRAGALVDPLLAQHAPEIEALALALEKRRSVAAGGLWGASQALCLAALALRVQGPWLAVVSTEAEAQALVEDLEQFATRAALLCARADGSARKPADIDSDALRERLQVAQQIAGPPERRPRLLVASVLSLLEPIPDAAALERDRLELSKGAHLDVEHLVRRLIDAGFSRVPLVERAGELSLRGEILDVFPRASEWPLRIEMFDDEIESLRRFDPALQTSIESLERVGVSLAADPGGIEDGGGVQPHTLISPTTIVVEVEPLRIEDRAEGLRIQSASHQRALLALRSAFASRRRLELQSLPAKDVQFDTRSIQALSVGVRASPPALREAAAHGTRIAVACRTPAEADRFQQVLDEAGGVAGVEVLVGNVSKGFRWPALSQIVINHREVAGLANARRSSPARVAHKTRALQSFFELKPGDYVVHAVHGVALYRGLSRMTRGGGEEDHLHLEFADEVSLFVPGSRIDLVQRYVGAGGKGALTPPLDKIGGQSFRRRREKVERALFDLASELLEVQAKRELSTRPPWLPDAQLVESMKGEFPFVDTPDQATTDLEIAANLASEHPMDRLLCGDVGFGKTEIAIRAAFRVAAAGGQVAVLVPTTVLAHQHYLTFRERLSDFALEIGVLTRTVGNKDSRALVERIASGEIDIVVGTHRLLSKDVQFKHLGLVIIDEEQRFGVTHKEHFKTLREKIDILTLSATPIPRTLHMSLSGVRDISALSVAPPGRQEIETALVDNSDDAFIREAFLREKNRGGQIFFLHNRVNSIVGVAHRLMTLVPECSFAIGHGQMGARALEEVMDVFSRGDADCLVATTIVENGLDIPAAGTIFIDEANHFGLAELHQLRGRVGRGQYKAHCYLLVDPLRPMREVARERLKALEELNQLGAGFQISM
ncbi:MAG: DEAD/DEAH box helicase, partial [Planctomycetota bacterium]